jgi:putative exporter of polyketide antibiotics
MLEVAFLQAVCSGYCSLAMAASAYSSILAFSKCEERARRETGKARQTLRRKAYLQHCKICLLGKCHLLSITGVSIVAMLVQPTFQNLHRVFREVPSALPHSVTPSRVTVTPRLKRPPSSQTDFVLGFRPRVLLICAAGRCKSFPCWKK